MEGKASARPGGRHAQRDLRSAPRVDMLPGPTRGLPVLEAMTPEMVERIDRASMDILEEVGVVFRDSAALKDWRRAGADVRGERRILGRLSSFEP